MTDTTDVKPAETHPKKGDVYHHTDTGRTFVVVAVGRMKQEGGNWYDAVTYEDTNKSAGTHTFTRATSAFLEKFTLGGK